MLPIVLYVFVVAIGPTYSILMTTRLRERCRRATTHARPPTARWSTPAQRHPCRRHPRRRLRLAEPRPTDPPTSERERKTDAQPVGSAARSGHYRALGSARTHAEIAAGGGCGRWRRSLYFDRHSGLVMPC
jgi:hypothetical protein